MPVDPPVVVVLAAGRGTRMRAEARDGDTAVRDGVKAAIRIAGRPFIDHVLDSIADAGAHRVVIVVRGDHEPIRGLVESLSYPRLEIGFAVQATPRGTADAVHACRDLVGSDRFVVINGDNFYSSNLIRAAMNVRPRGLIAMRRSDLVEHANFGAERIASFAVVGTEDGRLTTIREKPTSVSEEDPLVSMTLWSFDAEVWTDIASVPESVRGERELPDAVSRAIGRGLPFVVEEATGIVLDLTSPDDIATVEHELAAKRPDA